MAPPPEDKLLVSASARLAQAVLEAEDQPGSASKHGFALSKRDGHLLPLVPRNERISKEQYATTLSAALHRSPHLASDLASSQPIQGRPQPAVATADTPGPASSNEQSSHPGSAKGFGRPVAGPCSDGKPSQRISSIDRRCTLALVRSIMYLEAGNANQALKDARWAMSHAPQVSQEASPATQTAGLLPAQPAAKLVPRPIGG
jgi:hypothetical protein